MGNLLQRNLFRVFAATPQGKRLLSRLANAESDASNLQVQNAACQDLAAQLRGELAQNTHELSNFRDALSDANKMLIALGNEKEALRVDKDILAALCEERDRILVDLRSKYSHIESIHSISKGQFPFVPNGHFYSAIPSLDEIQKDLSRIYPQNPPPPVGIDLRENHQLSLLRAVGGLQDDMPFSDQPSEKLRYGFDNPAYSYSDALFLNGVLRLFKPQRIIEVGSGHSSCMTLDTNDLWLEGRLNCTFIEPYPELLLSLIKPADVDRINVIAKRVQDVGLDVFRELRDGDVLFIDSTHVSKIGSDVNYLFLEVLPSLAPGVLIHIHDIFYPFEYPSEWVFGGRAWNEIYILRALLQRGSPYEILVMNSFLAQVHPAAVQESLPLAMKNPGGSIWIRKTGQA